MIIHIFMSLKSRLLLKVRGWIKFLKVTTSISESEEIPNSLHSFIISSTSSIVIYRDKRMKVLSREYFVRTPYCKLSRSLKSVCTLESEKCISVSVAARNCEYDILPELSRSTFLMNVSTSFSSIRTPKKGFSLIDFSFLIHSPESISPELSSSMS